MKIQRKMLICYLKI